MSRRGLTRRQVMAAAAAALAGVSSQGCKDDDRRHLATQRTPPAPKPEPPATEPDPPATEGPPKFTWKPLSAEGQGPGPRSRHCFAYDRGAKAAVLFGGIRWDGRGTLLSDTWELSGGQWSRVEAAQQPPARHRGAMAYDVRRARCILFGGQGQQGFLMPVLGDTWAYAERQWRLVAEGSASPPRPRCGHVLAFDETAGVTVLFGGVDGEGQSLGDTWLFDGRSWEASPGGAPPARRYAAFAYDPDLKGCVLNGGSADDFGGVGFGDTWLFRERTWKRLPRKFDTGLNDDHGLAYHRAAKQLVMFGGLRGGSAVYVREAGGWHAVKALPVPARHQCAPLAWDEGQNAVVYHGGETGQGGRQFDTTWLLQLPA